MTETAPIITSAILGLQALSLGMARAITCTALLPCFDKRYMAALHRNAICMAISLPQTWVAWEYLSKHQPLPFSLIGLGFKEAVLGLILGLLISLPYWTVQSVGTLVDNQRGGNAAQNINPSMEADSSLLGELAQRTLIAMLIETGIFVLMFDVIADSYKIWQLMAVWPDWGQFNAQGITRLFQNFIGDSIVYAGPVLLLLLVVEFGMAISSSSVKGLDVYQTAMPIKSLLSLLMLSLYFGMVLKLMLENITTLWSGGLLRFVSNS